MKAVLLIACICIASTAAAPDPVTGFVRIFGITEDEARYCINKTNLVIADMRALEYEMTELSEERLLEKSDTRRAICSITCAAQAQGTMIGAKMNAPKIHAFIDSLSPPPEQENTRAEMHEHIDICTQHVNSVTDECETGLRFLKCMIERCRIGRSPR